MPEGRRADDAARWFGAMRRGDYAGAWAVSDAVLAARDPKLRDDPCQPFHRRWVWDGTRPEGRDVLVRCYHGLGDTVQYARFLPLLAALARCVTVEAPPALIPLLIASNLGVQCLPFDPAQPLPPSSCGIEIMELSHALRVAPDRVAPPYLRIPQIARGVLRDNPVPLVGLCWRAGAWNAERSIALDVVLSCLPPQWRVARLQPALLPEEEGCEFINDSAALTTLLDTAALIASTSLVITVDTMIAHLAGALGHPTMVLLKHDADWRWESGSRSGWYPHVRLFRQSRPGDWAGALVALKAALERLEED